MIKRIASVATMGAALALLATSASAQITKQPKGYLFRFKFTKGLTASYDIRTTVSNGANISSPFKLKVLNVVKGIAEIESVVGPMVVNGKAGKARTVRAKVDSRGAVSGDPSMSGAFVAYPQGPIPVGGTWKSPIPIPGAQNLTLQAVYKFVGIKTVGGKQLAQLNVKVSSQFANGTGTTFISVADGLLWSNSMTMDAQGITMTATLKRK